MPVSPPQGHNNYSTVVILNFTVDSVGESAMAYIKALVEGVDVTVLINSGSNVSLISKKFRISIPTLHRCVINTQNMYACGVNGQLLDTLGTVTLQIELWGRPFEQNLHVVQGTTQAILLGFDFIRQTRWTLSYLPGQELKLHPGTHIEVFHHVNDCDMLRIIAEFSDSHKEDATLLDITDGPLSADQRHRLQALLVKHQGVFNPAQGGTGNTNLIKHHIQAGDHPPIKQRAYCTSL